jgi:hypothetical protein
VEPRVLRTWLIRCSSTNRHGREDERDTRPECLHPGRKPNVETTFSMITAKFGDSLRSKSEVDLFNEVLW